MTNEQRTDFPATALIDTRLKVLGIADAGDDLLTALEDLVAMGRAGDDPALVLDSSGTRHLVWGGYLSGGLIHGLAPHRARTPRRRGLCLHR